MADRHAELHSVDREKLPGIAGYIVLIFARVDLVFGLVALQPALGVKDIGGNLAACPGEPFRAQDRGDGIGAGILRHRLEHVVLLRLAEGQYGKILAPQPRQIGFGEAHDLRALGRSIGQEPLNLVQAVVEGGRDRRRRQANDHG